MKNIYILPTDKQSKLFKHNDVFFLNEQFDESSPKILAQNIYITSDEEIKDGDCCIEYDNIDKKWLNPYKPTNESWDMVSKANHCRIKGTVKKIILTTNQDLIKNGIQAINDEFLEWFVKNPSCEFVELIKDVDLTHWRYQFLPYKIIIPKEEPKQETIEEAAETEIYRTINEIISGGKDLIKGNVVSRGHAIDYAFDIALKIANWQAEKMYSEEEVHKIIESYQNTIENNPIHTSYNQWFEEFKKK